jgi:uncharacterized membrane protein (GlpM family)
MKAMVKTAIIAVVVMIVVAQLSKRVTLVRSLVPFAPAA